MAAYILRRFALMIPTLFGIMLVSFTIVQFLPGGPIERIAAQMRGTDAGATASFSGGGSDIAQMAQPGAAGASTDSRYGGARGLDPELVKELEKQFGFDKPPAERFFSMIKNYLTFDFGKSYFRDASVLKLIKEKLPVSISIGLWLTLLSYAVSIPLGIRKAVKDGTKFDIWTSTAVIAGHAIPPFAFAILLIVLFAGGSVFNWVPLRGLSSENAQQLSWPAWILDYFWHLVLPLTAMGISSFATITFLTKNSFLDEIRKQYVMTARAKGLTERRVLYGHVFRNAMLLVIAGFPSAFIGAFFSGSILIENIFHLDGLGLLSFESLIKRDYAVVFATLYVYSCIGLLLNLLSDLIYTWIDPRIDFETREV
jgi:microcin C transport system permease protein